MPYTTDFWGSLVTDKPIPAQIQEQLEFLFDIDTRSLFAPLDAAVPEGFPLAAVAELSTKGIYRCDLCVETDTEIKPKGTEYDEVSVAWVQFIIDTFLRPNDIKVAGRIQAAGESGVSDLWCIVVGEDQVAHSYDGDIVYEDQPGYPSADGLPTPIQRLGLWLSTNAGLPDDCSHDQVDELINSLSGSSVPEAIGCISDAPSSSGRCDECDAATAPTFESAPGPFHDESCSLSCPDSSLGDVKVTPQQFTDILRRIGTQDTPSS